MTALPPQLKPEAAIHDPVHGRIWLTKPEINLINTPEFQRLRGISQLKPVDLVFPGATHNRFAHSVGAAHIIGMIAAQPRVRGYFEKNAREPLVQLLRLAALLHDVGHLPFSHVGEMAWLEADRAGAFSYHDDASGPTTVFDTAAQARAKPPLHEQLSQDLIVHSRLAEIIDASVPDFEGEPASQVVARIVAGRHPDLVARNLLSSDLDCDRLDYLLRDSLTAGLVYGHIDLAYLIGALTVAEDAGEPTLAIDERHGLLTGEHFLLARYYHYAQFVTHKTVAAAEVNLVAAILELIRVEQLPGAAALIDPKIDAADRIATLMKLTDAYVQAKIEAAARGELCDELIECARRLVERKLPKIAERTEGLEPAPTAGKSASHAWDSLRQSDEKQKAATECGVDPRKFFYRLTALPLSGVPGDMSPAEAIRDMDGLARGVRKAAKVSLDGGPTQLLIDKSHVLKNLANHVWTTRRVFVLEPLDSYEPRAPTEDFERVRAYFAKRR